MRELRGWAPRTVTVDSAGKVVSVTVAEPRFRRGDVELLLAARRESKRPRGSHGHLIDEATDPANRGRWTVPLPEKDYAQELLSREQEARRKKYPGEDTESLLWSVELLEPPQPG